jgi:DNA-binding winged helix-turn-helix (wHTH) protein/tetratricopeptide (TPR) repeat protein
MNAAVRQRKRSENQIIRFAGFELDARNAVLRKNGSAAKLSAQPFKALVFLASRPGELVTRDELRQMLWGAATVDFEHGLNTCIRQIRTVLDDSADAPAIIETVPRLGYRFKAKVELSAATETSRIRSSAVAASVAIALALIGWTYTRRSRAPNPEAVALYVKGVNAVEERTPGGYGAARRFFERAIAIDSAYAEPHAALARWYLEHGPKLTAMSRHEALPRATEEARRASLLGPTRPEPHLAMALVDIAQREPAKADAEYRQALELTPGSPLVHEEYGLWLAEQGRFEDALREARLAENLEPSSARGYWVATLTLRWAKRYDEAIGEAQKGLAVNPTFGPIHHELGVCYQEKRDFSRAFEEYQRSGDPWNGNVGHAYAVAGRIAEAHEVLRRLESGWESSHVGAEEIAQVYIGLGDLERAFEWLSRAADDGYDLVTIKVASIWDPLRSDPRFVQLLNRSPFARVQGKAIG